MTRDELSQMSIEKLEEIEDELTFADIVYLLNKVFESILSDEE